MVFLLFISFSFYSIYLSCPPLQSLCIVMQFIHVTAVPAVHWPPFEGETPAVVG